MAGGSRESGSLGKEHVWTRLLSPGAELGDGRQMKRWELHAGDLGFILGASLWWDSRQALQNSPCVQKGARSTPQCLIAKTKCRGLLLSNAQEMLVPPDWQGGSAGKWCLPPG